MPLPVAIGSKAFRQAVATACLQGMEKAINSLVELPKLVSPTTPGVQVSQLLLRMCILPRVIHMLRSSFTDAFLNLVSAFDVLVREAFGRLVACTFGADDLAGRQFVLRLRSGGCGYTSMRLIAPAVGNLGSLLTYLGAVEAAVGRGALLADGAVMSPTRVAVARAEANLQPQALDHRPLDWRGYARDPAARVQSLLAHALHHHAVQAWIKSAPA